MVLKLLGSEGAGLLQTFCKTTVDIAQYVGAGGSEQVMLSMPFTKASGFGNAAQGQPLLKLRISLSLPQVGTGSMVVVAVMMSGGLASMCLDPL